MSSLPCSPNSSTASFTKCTCTSSRPCENCLLDINSSSNKGNIISKLKRNFSRGRSFFQRRRKSSQDFLDDIYRDNIGRRLSNASRDSLLLQFQNENIYRGLLRCLLHPLGIPDSRVGLRPGDLVDRLREIFEIEREEHEYFIKEESAHRPKSLQVNVTVVEGKNLKSQDTDSESSDFYCLVSIVYPLLKPSKSSPKNSPKNSPKTSPKLRKNNSSCNSLLEEDVLKTQSVKNSTDPKWNEEFQLHVDDFLTDEVHIYVCDKENEDINNGTPKHNCLSDKHHGIKHLFHILRHVTDEKVLDHGCIGKIIIPVRTIPAGGADWWWDVMSSGCKHKTVGQCRVKLDLCHRQGDFSTGEYFSVEDYYQAAQQVIGFAAKSSLEVFKPMDPKLHEKDRKILDMFATSHHISTLSQSIIHVICLLEWTTTNDAIGHTQVALYKAVQELQMTWVTKQFNQSNLSQKMPITDAETALYRKASRQYIRCICNHLGDLPLLFPLSIENLNTLKSKLGVTVQLLELDLWESSQEKEVTDKILTKLQADVDLWITQKLATVVNHDVVKDTVIPEMNILEEIIQLCSSHCSTIGAVRTFFNLIDIKYYRVVSFSLEKKISDKVRELMYEMDKYQHRYHNYPVNITASSRLSLKLYFAVRKFYNVIREDTSRRDVFRLSISHYQQWFQESVVFWVQTFKNECVNRIEKALEIDKDVVVVTSLVKFSNSSVDVISCFAKITAEWRQIDFHEPDTNLMGVTKITDLICDGARMYADKIHFILERNCYYDDELEQFDVTERLCITLNNIEHVRKYLTELSQLLDWDSIIMLISTKYENDRIGNQALSTLQRLVKSADNEIILKSQLLLQQIAEKMKVDIARFMEIFTQKLPGKASSVDQLIGYLSTNLKVVHERLMASIYPRMTEQLMTNVVQLMDEQLLVGERPEYYSQMKRHLRALTSYFVRGGMEDEKVHTFLYQSLKSRLDLNAMASEELMLDYFSSLADNVDTPTEYYGHLAIKTAYMEETRGNVTLFIKVIRASDLPGLDTSGLSDPYVIVNLQPQTMFGHHKPQRTRVVDKTLNPVFNTVFHFPNIPKEYLLVRGAVVLLSVLDHDHLGSDDFAGEIVMHLSSVAKIKMWETVDSRPVVMLPVKRPVLPHQGPYQILTERCPWDKSAKMFVSERGRYIHKQPQRTDKPSKFSNFFSFFSSSKT